MKSIKYTIALLAILLSADASWAYKYIGAVEGATNNNQSSDQTRAAACAPSSALTDLAWNNVSALIETGGSMWQDRAQSQAAYEVPIGGNVSA
ncbi:MAG: hypothetical protein NWQ53_02005, partial [Flavobacteriales bacterium]|nr:hypothetical protein [Flavobacteriales bacterium]